MDCMRLKILFVVFIFPIAYTHSHIHVHTLQNVCGEKGPRIPLCSIHISDVLYICICRMSVITRVQECTCVLLIESSRKFGYAPQLRVESSELHM